MPENNPEYLSKKLTFLRELVGSIERGEHDDILCVTRDEALAEIHSQIAKGERLLEAAVAHAHLN